MGLIQDIVVVNEFTHNHVKTPGKGSRGGSIGNYILQYVTREAATETLSPVQVNEDGSISRFNHRYRLREETTNRLKSEERGISAVKELKDEFREIDLLSGRSFGNRGVSLSEETLRYSSGIIQQSFDEGRVANKMILSFTEEYLKEHQIVDAQYQHQGRGGYKGNIDQLKLRHAVINGMDKMMNAGGWSDPEWVASIQLDTNQVHVHIALADKELSPKREIIFLGKMQDRGKLTDREMLSLRRGIHHDLVDSKQFHSFHNHVSLERQNVAGFVKDYAYDQIGRNSKLQVLVAALPEDKRMWRYGTNRREMKRANELAIDVVQDLFKRLPEKSGYSDATQAVYEYARNKRAIEGFDLKECRRLVDNGLSMIEQRAVNGLFDSLKEYEKDQLPIQTTMLDIQSSSEDELLRNMSNQSSTETDVFNSVGFELRVRGYNKRRDMHELKSREYKQLIDEFDTVDQETGVSDGAYALRRLYEEELEWHMRLADKYRYFFKLHDIKDRSSIPEMKEKYESLLDDYNALYRKDQFLEDSEKESFFDGLSFDRASFTEHQDELNLYIKDTYGVDNGARAFSGFYREAVVEDISSEKQQYGEVLRAYTYECFEKGVGTSLTWSNLHQTNRSLNLDDYRDQINNTPFVPPVEPVSRLDGITSDVFDQVKSLDIHHLGIDYYGRLDRDVSTEYASQFAETMQYREVFEREARRFLEATGQQAQTLDEVQSDIESMRQTVDYLTSTGQIPVVDVLSTDYGQRNTHTIRVDEDVRATDGVYNELALFDPIDLESVDNALEFDEVVEYDLNDLE